MVFANYGRKSVFSDKSDSVDNQLQMSKDYATMHFPGQVETFLHYSDEDFTGANTDRPDLQRLLNDVRNGSIDVLIVYQLDRLSRDVRDFANIYAILEEHGVHFVSVKENIDTTTPIGRAMMYVTVVFAQMERETIAARVTDNLIGLAKKGYWTGGNPPRGYVRSNIIVNGKKHVTIVPDPDGVAYVTNIFDTFLDGGFSLQGMETYYRKNGIRTCSGAFFSTTQLHKILTMPYCVEATPEVYDYFEQKGCLMDPGSPREKWDGAHGVMIYGRSTERHKKHQLQPPEKWLVCLGLHDPFMPADKWLAVQARFTENKFIKTAKYDVPLLKGALRCSCGSIMPVSRKKKVDGSVSSWYYCLKRMRQGVDACPRSQIKTDILDEKVLDVFRQIEHDPELIRKYAVTMPAASGSSSVSALNKQIASTEGKIRRLAGNLAILEDSAASKYIIEEMERLDAVLSKLKQDRLAASHQERLDQLEADRLEDKAAAISSMLRDFDSFSASEKNEVARRVLSRCVWDGETLFLSL